MIKVGKPIIGHFPNLDLALIYHAFLGNIPATYEEYCERLLQKFPLIFDTKIISRRLQSSLKNLKVDLKSLFQGCFNPKLL